MAITEQQQSLVEDFRSWIESKVQADENFGDGERVDREDGSTLATRFKDDDHVWYEVAVRPLLPQVRVGILTDDRWRSEDFEQMIEDSGDTMQEFVELGFETADLEWVEPPVEHYREHGQYFYFATPLDLESLDQIEAEPIREKILKMLEGYRLAFSGETE